MHSYYIIQQHVLKYCTHLCKGSTSGMMSKFNNSLMLVTVIIAVTTILKYSWNKTK